jgi:hypothetical protein
MFSLLTFRANSGGMVKDFTVALPDDTTTVGLEGKGRRRYEL